MMSSEESRSNSSWSRGRARRRGSRPLSWVVENVGGGFFLGARLARAGVSVSSASEMSMAGVFAARPRRRARVCAGDSCAAFSRTGLLDMGGASVPLRGSSSSCVCVMTSSREGNTSGKLGEGDLIDSISAPDVGLHGGEERGTWTTGDSLRLVPREPELEIWVPLSLRFSSSGAAFRTLSGVDSAWGRKSSKSKFSVSSRLSRSLSSTSVVCCTMRSRLGCRALLLKLVRANMDFSCAGVAPTLMADGGRVP